MSIILPTWLHQRFQAMYDNPPHYEASYYGPITMLLTTYFPAHHEFLVKPQPRLRRSPSVANSTTSLDSYGQTVSTHNDDDIPDFLVCLGSTLVDADVPFLLCEVKREANIAQDSPHQLDRYIGWMRLAQLSVANIQVHVIVIHGSITELYSMDQSGFIVYSLYETTGTEFLGILQNIHDRLVTL
jgi:hypothetical protein